MAALFYINENDHLNRRYEFSNSESVMEFLSDKEEGEFFTQHPAVKIRYNAKTGDVDPVDADDIHAVEISYSRDLFLSVITLVADAICILAKCDLLLQLLQLGDPNLSRIIRKNHIDPRSESLINKNPLAVEQTLSQILNDCDPNTSFWGFKSREKTQIQKAVYEVLTHPDHAIAHIHSRGAVLEIMEMIKEKII